MKKIYLKRYKVSEDIFNKILLNQKERIKYDDLDKYKYGYKDKKTIIYNGVDCFICREMFVTVKPVDSIWKQVFVILDRGLEKGTFVHDIRGNDAWNKMTRLLEKYYSTDEITKIFNTHTHNECKPMHFNPIKVSNKIKKYSNCYKYDINSAYCSAYITMFPKAAKDILKLYEDRHIHPENKQILNYFNGMLKRKGYEGTYYWVVNKTNEKMRGALNKVGGTILYINTDGFIVKDPCNPLIHSMQLGEFKEEYKGDIYVYIDKNYFIIQTGDKFTGNCLLAAREKLNLSKGIVVHYDRQLEQLSDGLFVYVAKNIIEEHVEIE